MNVYVTHSYSVDRDILVSATFEREGADANTPTIEAVFDTHFPESSTYSLAASRNVVLVLLSATRTDTRTPVELTPEERKAVFRSAAEHAATLEDCE